MSSALTTTRYTPTLDEAASGHQSSRPVVHRRSGPVAGQPSRAGRCALAAPHNRPLKRGTDLHRGATRQRVNGQPVTEELS